MPSKEQRNVWSISLGAAVVAVLFFAVMKMHAVRAKKESERILREFKTIDESLKRSNDSMLANDTLIKFHAK